MTHSKLSEVLVLAASAAAWLPPLSSIALSSIALSCGSSELDEPGGPETGSPAPLSPELLAPGEGSDDPSAMPSGGGESTPSGLDFGVSDERTNEIEVVCAAQSAASELRHVYLAFAFDVSGSMGGNSALRYNTKWLPVVAASEAFFAEPESAAISASVTFFPDADESTRCTDAAYLVPDVPQTLLPTPTFAAAIAGLNYTLGSSAWRGSTPTLAAFNGTVASLLSIADSAANSTRAVVMVTDGVPAGCTNNDVQLVADAVRNSGIKTFVVGVADPPGDPGDNLLNLNAIAAAGGTEQAFIVATGDPAQTEADFKAVIDNIRGIAVSCNIEIPLPPTGSVFVPEQVNVTYGSEAAADKPLTYDADCANPGAWRYDDPLRPATIVLCDDTCAQAKADVSARLTVEFGCERRGAPR